MLWRIKNEKIGRNDLCPCGSGKKYKNCCINKLSKEKVYSIYLQQMALTDGLKEKRKCIDILKLGEEIIKNDRNYPWATGTYVNMALAKRVLYIIDKSLDDLIKAKELCEKALSIKFNNQSALKLLFDICTELKDYDTAITALEKYDNEINNPITIQVIETYQRAIDYASCIEYTKENKKFLEKVNKILFEKYGVHPVLCSVSTEFYIGIGNDVIKAYENGKRCVETFPNAATYNLLGWVCLDSRLDKVDESIEFYEKALELADTEEMKIIIKGNYFVALIKKKDYLKAEKIILSLIAQNPSNQNYSNYAELLKRQEKYEEAIKWAKKSLFLVEDETMLLV
ncbi:MAG: SEC-C metal-binding domain-containing protein [Clostridioides difficile]|nr:SEC-C metal-binding domain-containing protein [Clostridioides difficile]